MNPFPFLRILGGSDWRRKCRVGGLPCPTAPAFQTPTDVVEALDCDLLELLGSNWHDVDQEARAVDCIQVAASVPAGTLSIFSGLDKPGRRHFVREFHLSRFATVSPTELAQEGILDATQGDFWRCSKSLQFVLDRYDERLVRVRQQLIEEDDALAKSRKATRKMSRRKRRGARRTNRTGCEIADASEEEDVVPDILFVQQDLPASTWLVELEHVFRGPSSGRGLSRWKLFLFLPPDVVEPTSERRAHSLATLEERLATFNAREWAQLVETSVRWQ